MSNENDRPTPEHGGQQPPPRPPEPDAAGDDVVYELAELDLADSAAPAAEAVPDEGEQVSFELPPTDAAPEERTMGVAFADLSDLPPLVHVRAEGPGTPLHVEEIEPVSEFAPVAELLPVVEPESIDAEIPVAAEFDDEVPSADPASGEFLPTAEDVPLGDDPPLAAAASSSGLTGGGPVSDLFDDIPVGDAGSSAGISGVVPAAEAVPGGDSSAGVPVAEAAGEWTIEDLADVGNLEPLAPVAPASGWLDSQLGDQPIPEELRAAVAPDDGIEAGLAGSAPFPDFEASDIFASPDAPAATPADASDVLVATAHAPAQPLTPIDPPVLVPPSGRASDVALTFDQPPGGSTVHDPAADDDIPVAEEDGLTGPDSVFDQETPAGLFDDSARLAGTPDLAGAASDPGFEIVTDMSPDASSILADLGPGVPGASSAIRLEAPEMDGPTPAWPADPAADQTEAEGMVAWADPPAPDSGDLGDWKVQSGSDLFSETRTQPEFELLPDAGAVDPFADPTELDQASLASAPSSIFSAPKPVPGAGSSGRRRTSRSAPRT